MITVTDTARALIDSGRFVYHVRASAWLGDELLAEDVPIAGGGEEVDRTLAVPERVNLVVPRLAGGVDWAPTGDDSPLAARDQTLKISLGVGQGLDGIEWFQRGEYLITDTIPTSQQELAVTCVGLLTLADEAKFTAPFQPAGTLGGTLRKLLEPSVLVDLTDAPADRSITLTSINWDTDRLKAVGDVLDSWPAEAVMTEQGVLRVYPPDPPTTPVKAFRDTAGGTVVSTTASSTRGEPVDVVLVTGYTSDGAEVRSAGYLPPELTRAGQLAGRLVDKLKVPRALNSGLITSIVQASAAARFLMSREMRRYALKRLVVETTPDPTLQIGDCVSVLSEGVTMVGTVERLQLPYTPGPMTVEVVSLT